MDVSTTEIWGWERFFTELNSLIAYCEQRMETADGNFVAYEYTLLAVRPLGTCIKWAMCSYLVHLPSALT